MKTLVSGLVLAAIFALPATAAPQLCANGQVAIIRVSTLKADGTRAGFDKAVKDQIAWYRSHGVTTNKIVTADVIDFAGGAPALSTKEVMSIHYDPPGGDRRPASAR